MRHLGLHLNSLAYPGVGPERLFERAAAIARTAEANGFDSVWVLDHMIQGGHAGGPVDPMPEAFTMLGALAARTSSVALGTLVAAVGFRNPALLAKAATTLDVVSGGRAILGLGTGWSEVEHLAYGYPFPSLGERHDRLEEALQICRAMFTEERPTFAGEHYRLDAAINIPRPIQPDGPPILVGGNGEKRALRAVARYANMCCLPKHTPQESIPRRLGVLRRHCEEAGRDPGEILKLRKRHVVVAADRREARRRASRQREAWGATRKEFRDMVTEGDPGGVAEQVHADLEAGFDGVIINVSDDHELETVALAGQALQRLRAT